MSYGLRVWDASGNLTLDVSDRVATYVGAYVIPSLSALGSTYTLTHPSYPIGEYFFSTNCPRTVELTVLSGSMLFRKWAGGSNPTGNFYVFFYKS